MRHGGRSPKGGGHDFGHRDADNPWRDIVFIDKTLSINGDPLNFYLNNMLAQWPLFELFFR